jgi:hypothetical protein
VHQGQHAEGDGVEAVPGRDQRDQAKARAHQFGRSQITGVTQHGAEHAILEPVPHDSLLDSPTRRNIWRFCRRFLTLWQASAAACPAMNGTTLGSPQRTIGPSWSRRK